MPGPGPVLGQAAPPGPGAAAPASPERPRPVPWSPPGPELCPLKLGQLLLQEAQATHGPLTRTEGLSPVEKCQMPAIYDHSQHHKIITISANISGGPSE